MDLSFPPPTPGDDASLSAADIARLAAAMSERLGASATALAQGALDHPSPGLPESLLAPAGGAFNGAMAARLTAWKQP